MNTTLVYPQGALMCAKYSVPPNYFGYCGPDKNTTLRQQILAKTGDDETESILKEFETLYPYLKAIAYKNKIADPFDARVVEAYWIGNALLQTFSPREFVSLLQEVLHVDHKIAPHHMHRLATNLVSDAPVPHHTFHVMAIFRRTGADPSLQTISTMDSCRINAGTIVSFAPDGLLRVSCRLLKKSGGMLGLSQPQTIPISTPDQGIFKQTHLSVGDCVSFHWGMYCDTLTPAQVSHLTFYTQQSIDFFNRMNHAKLHPHIAPTHHD